MGLVSRERCALSINSDASPQSSYNHLTSGMIELRGVRSLHVRYESCGVHGREATAKQPSRDRLTAPSSPEMPIRYTSVTRPLHVPTRPLHPRHLAQHLEVRVVDHRRPSCGAQLDGLRRALVLFVQQPPRL